VAFIQSGSTRLTGLRPGPWKVTVSRAGGPGQEDGGVEKRIEVKVAETRSETFRLD